MYTIWVLLAYTPIYFYMVIKGPSLWDRFLALNLISTKMLLIIVLFAAYQNSAYLLDLAIAYELIWFISIVFIAPFLQKKHSGGDRNI